MQVFGLEPLAASIIFTIAGVGISNVLGWLKGKEPFNPRQVAASAIIAIIVSFQIVATTVQAIPDGAEPLTVAMIIFGVVGSVAGIDSMAKSGGKAAIKAIKP